MRQLSRALRANCFLSLRKPFFNAPPWPVYPTKSFATTPAHHKYQVPKRKKDLTMSKEMTTLKGKPFDRVSLESLMKACQLWIVELGVMLTSRSGACSSLPPSTSMAACPAFTITAPLAAP